MKNFVPSSETDFTVQVYFTSLTMSDVAHFQTLLAKIAKEQNFNDCDFKINEISTNGASYTSKLYSVIIKDKNCKLSLFAKIAAVGEKLRAQAPKCFDREIFAYNKLLKIYHQLEEDNNIPEKHKWSCCKFYGCNPKEYEETIVLEDLFAQGYSTYDRFKSVDWPYASSVVEELAKMHALSFAYQKHNPEEFQETIEWLKFEYDKMIEAEHFYKLMMERAVSNTRQENREKLRAYAAIQNKNIMVECFKLSRGTVITHGDYRPSNFLHRLLDDGKIKVKITDLQTLQGGSPVLDLIYFIVTGSDEQFRAAHYHQLVEHYYTQLSLAMTRLGLDPDEVYSREDFEYDLKEKLPFGLNIASYTLPTITVDTENAPQVTEELDMFSFSVEKTSPLYIERLNGLVNDYVKWGILK